MINIRLSTAHYIEKLEYNVNEMKKEIIRATAILVLIGAVYLLLRIFPLLSHSVAYTYDQGRDMMKSAEIVLYKNPTFIGPTTGISGLFHGAWWYYYLTVPFIIFGGEPIGFYIANMVIHLGSLVVLFFFLKKYFNLYVASLVSLLTAISPYFIATSLFIGNNIMTLPAILFFVLTHFVMLEQLPKKRIHQNILFSLMGLSIGMVAEFEFAFGLMIIPVYLVILFTLPVMRRAYFRNLNFLFSLGGLIFAFAPRMLFELRNNFAQTRTLLSFFINPKLYNPKAYGDIFADRLDLVLGFYRAIFDNPLFMWVMTSALVAIILGILWKKKPIKFKASLIFFPLLILGLFLFSTYYKDNFWPNYYEGFPYLYLICMALIFAQFDILSKITNRKHMTILILIVFSMLLSAKLVQKTLTTPIQPEGLAPQEDVVSYVVSNIGPDKDYCLRVYTPPVIPYTYDYLFFHQKRQNKIKDASKDFVDNQCWYIIERDDYAERRQEWLDANLPVGGFVVQEETFRDVQVQLWGVK